MNAQSEDMGIQDVGEPDFLFTGEEVARMRGPIVYLWTRGSEVLYVGMSRGGLARPLTPSHDYMRDVQPGDVLRVWRSGDPATLEDAMLYHLRPRLNRTKAVSCPTCARYVGQGHPCLERSHAPDPSFFVSTVRTNVARRPDHGLRTLRDGLCPETPTGAILPTRLPPEILAHTTPEQVDDCGDAALSRLGRNQGTPPDADTQVASRACTTCGIPAGRIAQILTEALRIITEGLDPMEQNRP